MSKKKIELTPSLDVDALLKSLTEKYRQEDHTTVDGLKIDFEDSWVHLRKSNTEPIIRIYTEATSAKTADQLADAFIQEIKILAGL
jgi:phosphomannomutase